MTIEVRQMLIRSVVVDEPAPTIDPAWTPQALEQLRQQLLAECKAWLAEQLRQGSER